MRPSIVRVAGSVHVAGTARGGIVLALALLMFTGLVGCGAEEVGEACLAAVDCTSKLCYANRCLDPAADDDGDGLSNADEHRIGTDPQRIDSDEDGKNDDVEVGPDPLKPRDRDLDGLPDAIESQSRDSDLDCLPDELDSDNDTPNTDPAVLARDVCSNEGICVGQAKKISASCQIGVGALTCIYTNVPGWSAVETCDGIDNDCDGATDEGHSYQGTAVGQRCAGEGACGEGVVQCKLGRAACSSNPGGSAAAASVELCNGLDDDCDGETDEGFGLPSAPVGVPCLGTGECGVGKVICGSDGVARCSTDPGGAQSEATPEVCNGLDDDCDGDIDELIMLKGAALGENCMGRGACGVGVIVCGVKGVAVCSSDPEGPKSKAKAETCNGLDDNCNGQTDEGFAWNNITLGAACVGIGACGSGKVVCSTAGKATCSSQPDAPGTTAVQESCDGFDDDCDGATDEGFVWQGKTLGQACVGVGICGAGVVECSKSGAVTCSSNADGSKSQSGIETCNGLDDNCDGVIDELVAPTAGPACPALGICAKSIGKPNCVSGSWSCVFSAVAGYQGPNETTCDGLDNDCDGLTDEGLPHTWAQSPQPFAVGAPAPRHGRSAAVAASATELCIAGGLAARINSENPQYPGELWCLNPEKSRWRLRAEAAELARLGGALVAIPAGWLAPKSRSAWWLLGGVSATGAAAPAVAIDAHSGVITPLNLPGTPKGGAAFTVGQQLWQVDVAPAIKPIGPSITRYDRSAGTWQAGTKVAQIGAAYVAAACQDRQAGLWLYGLDARPAGVVATDKKLKGSLWHFKAGATAWQQLPAPPPPPGWQALLGGNLLCEPAPGQVWLHGARSSVATLVGLRRYDINKQLWSQPSIDVTPKLTGAYTARVGKTTVMAWGRTATASSALIWAVQQGSWQPLHAGPLPAVGVRLLATPAGVLRVGGAGLLHTLETTANRPAWLHTPSGWKRFALPTATANSGRVDPLVAPAGADSVLMWGGAASLPTPVTATALQSGLQPTPGALRLKLSTGAWSVVPATAAAQLPRVRTGAALAHGTISGAPLAWVYGEPTAGGPPRLWRVQTATLATKQLWSGVSAGPAAATGAVLLWDAPRDRLLHIASQAGLQVWQWPLTGNAGWSKVVTDVSAAAGAVVVLGDLSITDPLIAILPNDSGAKPTLRRLNFGVKPALESTTLSLPTWRAPAQSVWSSTGAVVLPGPRADGVVAQSMLLWPRACAP